MQQVNERNVIEFKTANTAATHLGRKLYTSSPSALAELVANSYDAYATRVSLEIERNGTRIVVADNGVGMSFEGLQGQYAQVGQPKTRLDTPQGMKERRAMGKKGIGKLASFSLGNEFTVYTRDCASKPWISFTVRYADMINDEHAIKYETPCEIIGQLPQDLRKYETTSGFVVVINELRRKITKKTLDSLNVQLAKRFSLSKDDFRIIINGEEVDLSHREFLYQYVQALNYVGYAKDELKSEFPTGCKLEKYELQKDSGGLLVSEFDELVADKSVKAWVGVVDKPQRLTDTDSGGIVVYINGKIADEDLLKGKTSAQMGGNYVTGEIYADYLNDEEEEPITSSRQGLDQADEEVVKLVSLARLMQLRAIAQWAADRDKTDEVVIPKRILKDPKYVEWRGKLTRTQSLFHNKLLDALRVQMQSEQKRAFNEVERTQLINGFTTVVENVGQLELSSRLHKLTDNETPQLLELIGVFLGKLATQDKLQMASVAQSRLDAIKKLEELLGREKVIEKAFEDHLFDNPWLLNPFWNASNRSEDEVNMRRQVFTEIREEQGEKGYIDLCIEVAEKEYPIIVELKRADGTGHARPPKITDVEILKQIKKYRVGLWETYSDAKRNGNSSNAIDAMFIAPQNAFNAKGHSGLSHEDVQTLKNAYNIHVCTYQDLIDNAKRSYREFFEASKIFDRLPYFIVNDTNEDG